MPVTEYFLLHGLFMSLLLQHRLHSGYCFQSWSKQSCCLRCCFCGRSGTDRSGLLLCSGKHHFQGTFCGTETCIIFKRTAFSKKPDYIVTVVRFFYLAHLKQESYLIQLISIAISQNNAIKTFSRVRKTRKISDAVLHILMGWIALSIS